MKIPKLLAKLNDIFRPSHLQGEQPLAGDKIDAMTTIAGTEIADLEFGPGAAPSRGWVPSQQDDRPRH